MCPASPEDDAAGAGGSDGGLLAPCPLCRRRPSAWELDLREVDPALEGTREVLSTLANGYLATRGAAADRRFEPWWYPGTYVAGVFDRATTVTAGRIRVDESIVRLPDWLSLAVSPDAATGAPTVEHDHRLLDMRRGVLIREARVRGPDGFAASIRQERWVSLRHPHRARLLTRVTPHGWSGVLRIDSGIHAAVTNDGVASFTGLENRHLDVPLTGTEGGDAWVMVRTRQSRIDVALATRTSVDLDAVRWGRSDRNRAALAIDVVGDDGQAIRIDKSVAVFTSRDHAISEPLTAARRELDEMSSAQRDAREHRGEWRHVWRQLRLRVTLNAPHAGEQEAARREIRLHLFHVAQSLSRHTADADVGVPARGLHGEAYRGHVFWDELFVFPVLNLRMPELTRALLMYRYRRLPEARRRARELGFEGALFPWQSGSDGREETAPANFNPHSGRWVPDHSWRQHHVNLAVGYNVWQFYQVSGDRNFLASYGAEMLVDIARFWVSRVEEDPRSGRFHLRRMMGPDEFHDGYPDRPGEGIDDNAYVAVMTSWLLRAVLRAHAVLGARDDDQWEHLGVTEQELQRWDTVSRRLFVPFLDDGMLAQFDGYGALPDLDLDAYRRRYGDISRLDLLLEAEGDSANRYRVSKQADVLMLFYVLSAEELTEILDRLGYTFDPRSIPATIAHYLARTTHGSSLSRVVHAWVQVRGDRHASWHLLRDALGADIGDIHPGTTREGIHLGAMAATVDILQRCYFGVQVRDDVLILHPQLPDAISRLSTRLRYRGHRLELAATHAALELRAHGGSPEPVTILIDDARRTLVPGESITVRRARPGAGPAEPPA